MEQKIMRTEQNIRTAIEDYKRHTYELNGIEDISETFIHRLAEDSVRAKQGLRELFRKSPAWDEDLDAIVVNGNRTHDPDYVKIDRYVNKLFAKRLDEAWHESCESGSLLTTALEFFTSTDWYFSQFPKEKENAIEAIKKIAPKAYAEGKKKSRILRALCDATGVTDNTQGSEFQRLFALVADEMNAKKIDFKLFVSINPAHFLTMSNPKEDERGDTLVSCHSLNNYHYNYRNGCTGYARDEVSFIVFTVADPTDAESLNNRKTTRQMFAYRPGSGLLLQSRMYNTSGGIDGACADTKLYRDLVEREICMLEDVPNLWKPYKPTEGYCYLVELDDAFGGWPDWYHSKNETYISVRKDCDKDSVKPLLVGAAGLCFKCGSETSNGVFCSDHSIHCAECNDVYDEDDLHTAYNEYDEEVQVCQWCLDRHYTRCEECGEYHHDSTITWVGDYSYCEECRNELFVECDDCGEWHRRDELHCVHDKYDEEHDVCEDCLCDHYTCCECCGEWYLDDCVVEIDDAHYCHSCVRENFSQCENCGKPTANEDIHTVYAGRYGEYEFCSDCYECYEECPHCGVRIMRTEENTCPNCGVILNEDDDETQSA